MGARRTIVGRIVALALMVGASGAWATDAKTRSGSVKLTLNPLVSDAGSPDERWQVQVRDVAASAKSASEVQGAVRVAGIPIERPDRLGRVDWQLTGAALSGTVSSHSGGPVVAWFTGTVSANGIQGTFTAVNGQSGSWVWEGPVPEEQPAPAQ